MQTHRHAHAQTPRHPDTQTQQTPRHADAQTCAHADTRHADTQTCRHRHADAQTHAALETEADHATPFFTERFPEFVKGRAATPIRLTPILPSFQSTSDKGAKLRLKDFGVDVFPMVVNHSSIYLGNKPDLMLRGSYKKRLEDGEMVTRRACLSWSMLRMTKSC